MRFLMLETELRYVNLSRMIRLTFLTFLVFGFFFGPAIQASVLVWDRTEVSLEMAPDQKDIRATFNVTNKGDDTVRISRIKTSCGCTGSIVDRKILKPGEATEVIATFNRGRRQGMNRNRLQVFIDDQKAPVATLQMTVNIPSLVEAKPQIVFWSPKSSKTSRQVVVTLDERYVEDIEKIEFDESQIEVVVEENPEKTNSLTLKVTPRSFDSLQRETITIHASGPDGRKAQTRIQTLVQP